MIYLYIYLAIACVSFVINTGAALAYFQGEYPNFAYDEYYSDAAFSLFVGLFTCMMWPVGLLCVFFLSDGYEHGFQFRRRMKNPVDK